MPAPEDPVVLGAADTSLVLDVSGPGLPRIRHFGADPGAAGPALRDGPDPLSLLPTQADRWYGRPAVAGHRESGACPLRLRLDGPATVDARPGAGGRVEAVAADAQAGIRLASELRLEPSGVLRMRHTLTNTGQDRYTVHALTCLVPLAAQAREVLDFTGHWAKEKVPQRAPLRFGVWSRENRRGRTGHDATGLLLAGTPGFGFRHGEVWGVHVGWSGDHLHYIELMPEGRAVLGGGELLSPGEITLGAGQSYQTPWVYFAVSGTGLDGLRGRLHRYVRAHSDRSRTTRPVTLNNWEATYFDHGLPRLRTLADRAARVGVERFVLDDGWFRGRRDDRAGLGDWYVDEKVWPQGLHPLVDHVRSLGMQFGLWFEPEMVNPDSDLAREHPDWILAYPGRWPLEERNQQTLDVAHPGAYAYLLDRIDSLVREYRLDYLKWDHNRDIAEPVHDGVAGVHAQTLATYRLLDELRARHPHLEIESCSSGGARIDYGILARTDRVWTSDCNDALERQAIQRWTGLLVPPELMGGHVGSPVDHSTGRALALAFRCATAMFVHMGIEWDLTAASEAELDELARWIGLHKRLRPLLHHGDTVHADHPDPAAWVHGVVASGAGHAVYAYVQLDTSPTAARPPLRLPGLRADLGYAVSVSGTPGDVPLPAWARPGEARTLPGRYLAEVGLPAPALRPGSALIVEVRSA